MVTPPAALEAILFTIGGPVEKKHLATLLAISPEQLEAIITALTHSLEGHGLSLIETASEVELRTSPDTASILQKLRENELARDLGKGSLETLAVIAYQNNVSRGEIDWVRGVNSSASIRTLLMRGLIEGKEDAADKRRIRYTITTEALAHLGLTSTDELPRVEELRATTTTLLEGKAAQEATPAT